MTHSATVIQNVWSRSEMCKWSSFKLSTIDLFPTIRCQNQFLNEIQQSESLCSIGLDVCLGDYFRIFFRENNIQISTSGSSLFEIVWTWSWTMLIILCISNIPDFYFLYSCTKEVKRSDENVKNMMSNQAYVKRKR